jgi:hypothetical protein
LEGVHALNEDQCRVLATIPRRDVELNLTRCGIADDAAGAFIECLQSDRGPIKLDRCSIDGQILARALAGNSCVTSLKLDPYNFISDAWMAVLFTALANNRGLVDLDLRRISISNDNWSLLCESLKAHPTLTRLRLDNTCPRLNGALIEMSADQIAQRKRLLARMVQENRVLVTIDLERYERDEQIYAEMIHPYLETNLYRTDTGPRYQESGYFDP